MTDRINRLLDKAETAIGDTYNRDFLTEEDFIKFRATMTKRLLEREAQVRADYRRQMRRAIWRGFRRGFTFGLWK